MPIIKPIKPVDKLTAEVVREVENATSKLGVELLLVGAQAKVILLENMHDLNPGRATSDIDFAFAIENWDKFYQIKKSLIATGHFREVKNQEQRLMYQSSLVQHELRVDIIPFGGVQDAHNTIAWPPDMDVILSVSGYQDAFDSAILVEIDSNLAFKVVSLAGLTILKIFAWTERGTDTKNKDALDLLTLLRSYHEAGNSDRIYTELEPEDMEAMDYNPERMGAWLLGYDVAGVADADTVKSLLALLKTKKGKLVLHMAKSMADQEDALDITEALLNSFSHGINKNNPMEQ